MRESTIQSQWSNQILRPSDYMYQSLCGTIKHVVNQREKIKKRERKKSKGEKPKDWPDLIFSASRLLILAVFFRRPRLAGIANPLALSEAIHGRGVEVDTLPTRNQTWCLRSALALHHRVLSPDR